MSAIDAAIFAELKETTGADFVAELVDTFLEDAPKLLAALHEATASGDAGAFRRAAHSLKSNGNTFGAAALAGLARDLEHRGLDAVGGDGPALLAQVEQAYSEAATLLRSLINA